jgi:hypothetical protein
VPPHQLDVEGDVVQRHTLSGLENFFVVIGFTIFTIFAVYANFANFAIFDFGHLRLRGVPPRFEGRLTLGYTEAHQPFQRRLVDTEDDPAADVLAEEESERGDQC